MNKRLFTAIVLMSLAIAPLMTGCIYVTQPAEPSQSAEPAEPAEPVEQVEPEVSWAPPSGFEKYDANVAWAWGEWLVSRGCESEGRSTVCDRLSVNFATNLGCVSGLSANVNFLAGGVVVASDWQYLGAMGAGQQAQLIFTVAEDPYFISENPVPEIGEIYCSSTSEPMDY